MSSLPIHYLLNALVVQNQLSFRSLIACRHYPIDMMILMYALIADDTSYDYSPHLALRQIDLVLWFVRMIHHRYHIHIMLVMSYAVIVYPMVLCDFYYVFRCVIQRRLVALKFVLKRPMFVVQIFVHIVDRCEFVRNLLGQQLL